MNENIAIEESNKDEELLEQFDLSSFKGECTIEANLFLFNIKKLEIIYMSEHKYLRVLNV